MMNLINDKTQLRNKTLIYHVVLPLLIGSLIYVLFRSESLIVFNWLGYLGILEHIREFRELLNSFKYVLPNWVIYSLADGLWVYAFVSAYLIYFKIDYWLIVPFLLSIGIEILQYFQFFQGTFDVLDLIYFIIGYTLPFLLLKNFYQFKIKLYWKISFNQKTTILKMVSKSK